MLFFFLMISHLTFSLFPTPSSLSNLLHMTRPLMLQFTLQVKKNLRFFWENHQFIFGWNALKSSKIDAGTRTDPVPCWWKRGETCFLLEPVPVPTTNLKWVIVFLFFAGCCKLACLRHGGSDVWCRGRDRSKQRCALKHFPHKADWFKSLIKTAIKQCGTQTAVKSLLDYWKSEIAAKHGHDRQQPAVMVGKVHQV